MEGRVVRERRGPRRGWDDAASGERSGRRGQSRDSAGAEERRFGATTFVATLAADAVGDLGASTGGAGHCSRGHEQKEERGHLA